MPTLSPFHLAIPVNNLEICKKFYQDTLSCEPGRCSEHWADYDFFGHQLVLHYEPKHEPNLHRNLVDGHQVPIPHFGIVLPWNEFKDFAQELSSKHIEFIIKPYKRFEGLVGEQMTMFFYDPSGNALEFKSFKNSDQLFATK